MSEALATKSPMVKTPKTEQKERSFFLHDSLLIITMIVLAACGIIYQYLLSNYAGRVLGVMEHSIFAMIGVMIVSMGVGAFLAKYIKNPYTGFAWIEAAIAFLGSLAILTVAAVFALSVLFPQVISEAYGLPYVMRAEGGFIAIMEEIAFITPFLVGFILGALIGMEIPFIARVREDIYQKHLEHNVGMIYGADYLGAGIGAAIFIIYMLNAPIHQAAVVTASANLVFGLLFLFVYYKKIKWAGLLLAVHLLFAGLLSILFVYGTEWEKSLEDTLYADKVIFSHNTKYQRITITEYKTKTGPVQTLYINGHTQFSSVDEHMYHSMLVHPTMMAAARQDNVLIIGGGDGLALRDVLKWGPKSVTLLELDRDIVSFFKDPMEQDGKVINQAVLDLNAHAFSDPRVNVIFGNAFNTVDGLLEKHQKYDAIIVDLPDPSHPDLNKLYAVPFYNKLKHLLAGDGAISIQSTSPYHAKQAFVTVRKTMDVAGFNHVQQYHQNVPSFGEWGWTIATLNGNAPKTRIENYGDLPFETKWFHTGLAMAAFVFGTNFYDGYDNMAPNRLGSNLMYLQHQHAWESQNGTYTD